MPNKQIQPLFDEARKLKIGFNFGFAELVEEDGVTRHFNTAVIVNDRGEIAAKYRKIHLPGHIENETWRAFQHLEKRYFEKGNLGFLKLYEIMLKSSYLKATGKLVKAC